MTFGELYNTVLSELGNDHYKLECELERLINSNMNINEKIELIKDTLNQIALSELKINKWHSYLPDNENENEE